MLTYNVQVHYSSHLTEIVRQHDSLLEEVVREGPPPDYLDHCGQVDGGGQVELVDHLHPLGHPDHLIVVQHDLLAALQYLALISQY